MKPIAVVIPTFRRPDSLDRALRSVLAQDALDALVEEVVVVDNDPLGSAQTVVARLQAEHGRMRYIHAREPGVSNARNAGLQASAAPLVAFIDDDEEAPPQWLGALHAAHSALGVDVTFGPVRGRADEAAAWKRGFLERFFSRTGPSETSEIKTFYGCGNAMLTRATALADAAPFDIADNQTGGEDDRLFARLRGDGRRFGWAADAWLWEHAEPRRQSTRYAFARAFGYGQAPAVIAARDGDWAGVLRWMGIGAAQALVYGVGGLALATLGRENALPCFEKACHGLGKMIWFRRLSFYGAAAAGGPPSRRPGEASLKVMAAKITQ